MYYVAILSGLAFLTFSPPSKIYYVVAAVFIFAMFALMVYRQPHLWLRHIVVSVAIIAGAYVFVFFVFGPLYERFGR